MLAKFAPSKINFVSWVYWKYSPYVVIGHGLSHLGTHPAGTYSIADPCCLTLPCLTSFRLNHMHHATMITNSNSSSPICCPNLKCHKKTSNAIKSPQTLEKQPHVCQREYLKGSNFTRFFTSREDIPGTLCFNSTSLIRRTITHFSSTKISFRW